MGRRGNRVSDTVRVRVEQLVERGLPTSVIIKRCRVSDGFVKSVRVQLERLGVRPTLMKDEMHGPTE